MKVLVDTAVWSLALRRQKKADERISASLSSLIEEGRVAIIGPIRQELLSGIKDPQSFTRLREHLRAFENVPILVEDYEEAATFFNRCRARGVQGSNTDFLICSLAVRNNFAIFTTDLDFRQFAKILPITLFDVATLT